MKCLIICVNYNSYDRLEIFLKSVVNSIEQINNNLKCDVSIVDNSTERKKFNASSFCIDEKLCVSIIESENFGYFGSALKVYNEHSKNSFYDYIFITNVDLQVDIDFFTILDSLDLNEKVGWIAPSIFSKFENRDKNPQRINRCSKTKLQLLYLLYTFPVLERIYSNIIYPRRKNKSVSPKKNQSQNIYCGHGSFIILTKQFMKRNPILNYPCFLFCEELFLGEIIKNEGLKVIYEPSLKIFDDEHVSTGKLPSRNYYKYNRTSLSWILHTFYK